MSWIIHSQEGSEWKHHKYLKREGTKGSYEDTGKYYYPDSYPNGRHLPKGSSDSSDKKTEHAHEYGDDMQDWEKKVHDHLAGIIQKNPDMFKNGADVAKGILDDKNLDAVKNTLKAFGVNSDKMSDAEVKQLRQKIADFYTKNEKAVEEAKAGKKTESKKSEDKKTESKSTKSSKSKKSDSDSTETKKSSTKKSSKKKSSKKKAEETEAETKPVVRITSARRTTASGNPATTSAMYEGGYSGRQKATNKTITTTSRRASKRTISHSVDFISDDTLEHHGILGQKWGIRRFQNKDGSRTAAGKKREHTLKNQIKRSSGSRESDTLREARKKDINKMSDEELRKYNRRLQDERQFAELTKGNVSSGKKAVLSMAGAITSAIVTSVAIEAGKKILKSKLGL